MQRTQSYLPVAKILRAIIVIGAVFIWTHASAASEPGKYDGIFLTEAGRPGTLWYVDPDSHERYGMRDGNDFSRVLSRTGEGIRGRDLKHIDPNGNYATLADYRLARRFNGHILLDIDADGKAWYLNPLDDKLVELKNGIAGFEKATSLALDITVEHLSDIPLTQDIGFDRSPARVTDIPLPVTEERLDPDTYKTAFEILKSEHLYHDTFSDSDLYFGSLKGMAAGTGDPYTEFYPPEKNRQQQDYFNGGSSIEGIGAVLNARENSLYIVSLIKGAAAERSGLRSKDQIVEINGEATVGISVDRAVSLIKGPAGTSVQLRIYRANDGITKNYTITREKVDLPSVVGEMLDNNIAYIKFNLFTLDLIDQFAPLVQKYVTPSTQGIILDMRDNPGGVTSAAAQLADNWLTEGQTIFTERRPGKDTIFVASGIKTMPSVATVVLTNDETASASEIFTSALKYYKQATVIGEQTYGKGTGQNLVNFADGSGMKYTTFEWIPASGISINKKGITPDISVAKSALGDAQLERAKQFIRYGN